MAAEGPYHRHIRPRTRATASGGHSVAHGPQRRPAVDVHSEVAMTDRPTYRPSELRSLRQEAVDRQELDDRWK
jgi:hypothetical protein